MAKKVFVVASGKAQVVEAKKRLKLGAKEPDVSKEAAVETKPVETPKALEVADPSIIPRHTDRRDEVLTRIKQGKFGFVLHLTDEEPLPRDRFALIGQGQAKGKTGIVLERFADANVYAEQVRYWQERHGVTLDGENHGLLRLAFIVGACQFRWREDIGILIRLRHLSLPYVFPEAIVRGAADGDIRRLAIHSFAAFTRRHKKAIPPLK